MCKNLWIMMMLMVFSLSANAQQQGIGLRAGDPVGLTYKRYLPRNKAFEFTLGTESRRWRYDYYRDSFHDYKKYDSYQYVSHRVESNLCLQGRYLIHYDIPVQGMEGKWQWYWGVGGLLKVARVNYRYRDVPGNSVYDERADVDFGPEGILGTEYTFEDIPLTVFGDLSLMIELIDNPAVPQIYGGLGVRFNF
jgi:hypothetical protein